MKFVVLLMIFFLIACGSVSSHFPVYSLYKERKPIDVFQALASARHTKRRVGGFDEMYNLPLSVVFQER